MNLHRSLRVPLTIKLALNKNLISVNGTMPVDYLTLKEIQDEELRTIRLLQRWVWYPNRFIWGIFPNC